MHPRCHGSPPTLVDTLFLPSPRPCFFQRSAHSPSELWQDSLWPKLRLRRGLYPGRRRRYPVLPGKTPQDRSEHRYCEDPKLPHAPVRHEVFLPGRQRSKSSSGWLSRRRRVPTTNGSGCYWARDALLCRSWRRHGPNPRLKNRLGTAGYKTQRSPGEH